MTTKIDPQYNQHVKGVPCGGRLRSFGGLLVRKESWRLSGVARLILAIAIVGLATWIFLEIYSFLAITTKESTDTLIVEGWVHESVLRIAAKEFKTNGYKRLFTTGGPVEGLAGYVNDYLASFARRSAFPKALRGKAAVNPRRFAKLTTPYSAQSIRAASLNAIVRSTFPSESRTRISPER